ncbi:MAG: hypothetical protein U0414_29695 [Polyangiaceae bacterium]
MLLVATDHFTLEARVEDSLLELVRTRREFECALDVEVEADAIAGIAHGFEVRHGLIFDLRNGASDDRPQLEGALRRFIAMVAMPFERVAVIVSTHTAMHRVARITKDLPDKPLITLNAAQAEDHVRGLKATGTRRRPTSNAALDAVRAETDWARRAPVGRDEELAKTSPPPARPSSSSEALADMSGADLASTFVVDQLAEEVKALCTALDAWAMVREKVIDKLDIRGARRARDGARDPRGHGDPQGVAREQGGIRRALRGDPGPRGARRGAPRGAARHFARARRSAVVTEALAAPAEGEPPARAALAEPEPAAERPLDAVADGDVEGDAPAALRYALIEMGKHLEAAIGALNGLVGDWLAETDNGLATPMSLHLATRDTDPLDDLGAITDARRTVVVLAHGLMCSEGVWEFETPSGRTDYGSLLREDFGWLPLYLRYNSGLAISDNGRRLSALLDRLAAALGDRLEEIVFVGYSMGGLVVRSACHDGATRRAPWLSRARRAFYLGTPHQGAPLERFGKRLSGLLARVKDPYVEVGRDLVELRSRGVKDLGAPVIVDLTDPEHPLPLLPSIRHYLVAGSISDSPLWTPLFGDALVPIASATNGVLVEDARAPVIPPSNTRFLRGVNHLALAHERSVYGYLRSWVEEG